MYQGAKVKWSQRYFSDKISEDLKLFYETLIDILSEFL